MNELLDHLREQGILRTPHIIKAFSSINREDFVPQEMKGFAQIDEAIHIGMGQTISQPFVVAFMLEKLQPTKGQKILDIGSGSGWTSVLLASIVGKTGKVIALEVLLELKQLGETNAARYTFIKEGILSFVCADGAKGYAKEAPYDHILVSAALPKKQLPLAWRKQLKIAGRIVAPIQNSIWVFTKHNENQFEEKEYPGFSFVPFVSSI